MTRINPKNYSIQTLIGMTCHVDRQRCLISPSAWLESQHPENFELLMLAWEKRGRELTQL